MKQIILILAIFFYSFNAWATDPVGGDENATTSEDNAYTFQSSDFSFSDGDGHTFKGLRIISLPSNGVLKYNGATVAANDLCPDVTLLVYTPNADYNGSDSYQFKVVDSNNEESTSNYTMNITITAVHDAPTSNASSVTLDENASYTFVVGDFPFSDVDGDSFNGIKVTTTVASGTLKNNGANVTDGTVITKTDISSGYLVFTPPANANGSPYTTFVFQVRDDSGDAGTEYSNSSYSMTINVNAVNYPPIGGDATVTTDEDVNYTFASSDFPYSDSDGDAFAGIRVITVETNGDMEYNATDVTNNQDCPDVTKLVFKPFADDNGAGYATFTFKVKDATGDLSTTYTATINVNAAADNPTSADNSVTLNENASYTFVVGDFPFSDVDGNNFNGIKVTTTVASGTLKNSGANVTDGTVISKSDISSGNIVFTPVANANGSPYTTFIFQVRDDSGDAGTEYSGGSYTMTINVTPVNYPPTGGDATVTTDEDVNYTFASSDFPYSDSDGDAFAGIRVISVETNGNMEYNATDVTNNQDCPDVTKLVFKPFADDNGAGYATFTFKVKDATGDLSTTYTATINVNAAADNPTSADNTVSTNEDVTYTFVDADFSFADADGDNYNAVKIINLPANGTLQHGGINASAGSEYGDRAQFTFIPAADANGLPYTNFQFKVKDNSGDATTEYSSGIYTMTINVNPVADDPTGADATVTTDEDVNYTFASSDFTYSDLDGEAFNGIRVISAETDGDLEYNGVDVTTNQDCNDVTKLVFKPFANDNGAGYATFSFRVIDAGGALSANTYTATINVNAVAESPTSADKTVTTNEDVTYTFVDADFSFADADGDSYNAVKIINLPANGTLQYNGGNANTTTDYTNRTKFTFIPVANANGLPYTNFQFKVKDDSGDGATEYSNNTYTMTINVNPVADDPTGADATVTTDEDVNYTFASSDFTYSDLDGEAFNGIRVISAETDGDLEYNGVDVTTNQDCNDVTKLVFKPFANDNGAGYATFSFRVIDAGGSLSASTYTATINVNAVAESPTSADKTVTTNEDATYTFVNGDFAFSDVDGDGYSAVKIITLPANGTLQHNGGNAIAGSEYGDRTQFTFIPAANANGTPYTSFQFKVKDNSTDGATEYSSGTYTITVNVNPVSDPPSGTNESVTFNEDNNYTFATTDFPSYADPDGDAFNGIKISSPQTAGSLLYNGTQVTTNQICNDVTKLVFNPDANANGSPYATFNYYLLDATSTQSSITYQMSVNVTPVSDKPTSADKTVTTNEDITYTFSNSDFAFSDVDGDAYSKVRIKTLPAAGTLQYNGANASANTNYTNRALFTYIPPVNANGLAYTSFDFRVRDASGTNSASNNTITIDITPVADDPMGANENFTVEEDLPKSFSTSNFTFSDVDGDAFNGVRVISATALGTLKYNGVAVTTNQICNDVTKLSYQTASNGNGASYTTFNFRVLDNGAGESGSSYSMTINANAINDAPTFSSTPVTTCSEGNPYTYNIVASDVDNLSSVLSFTAVTKPTWLTLTDNGDGTAKLNGTPPNNVARTNNITIRVSDGSLTTDQTYVLTSAFMIQVPADYATIQAAINAANNGDSILVSSGTYTENINFNGKAVVVGSLFMTTNNYSYKNSTIIDGNQSGSVVTFNSGETNSSELIGFTITNGNGTYTDLTSYGNQMTVGRYGGGIYCWNSSPKLTHIIVYNNVASVSGNQGGSGGGIYLGNHSDTYLDSVRVDNNSSQIYRGGGVCVDNSDPTFDKVTVQDNKGGNYGGGLALWHSNPNFINITIKNNSANGANGHGGGLFKINSVPVVTSFTSTGNSATKSGNNSFSF